MLLNKKEWLSLWELIKMHFILCVILWHKEIGEMHRKPGKTNHTRINKIWEEMRYLREMKVTEIN